MFGHAFVYITFLVIKSHKSTSQPAVSKYERVCLVSSIAQISRLAGQELEIVEDYTVYSKSQIAQTLYQIQEGNKGDKDKYCGTSISKLDFEESNNL